MSNLTQRVVNIPESLDAPLRVVCQELNCNKSDFIRGAIMLAIGMIELGGEQVAHRIILNGRLEELNKT